MTHPHDVDPDALDVLANLTIEGRPTSWKRPNFWRGRYRTAEAQREAFDRVALEALRSDGRDVWPVRDPVAMWLDFAFPLPKSGRGREAGDPYTGTPDLDNLVKLVGDALNGVVYVDDRQVVEVHARKRYGAVPGTYAKLWRL